MDKISYTKRTAEDLDLLVFDICQMLRADVKEFEHRADVKNDAQDWYDAKDLEKYILQLEIVTDKITAIIGELRP